MCVLIIIRISSSQKLHQIYNPPQQCIRIIFPHTIINTMIISLLHLCWCLRTVGCSMNPVVPVNLPRPTEAEILPCSFQLTSRDSWIWGSIREGLNAQGWPRHVRYPKPRIPAPYPVPLLRNCRWTKSPCSQRRSQDEWSSHKVVRAGFS